MENQNIPIEIFLKIIKQLPVHQLILCKRVNKTWYSIISNDKEFLFEKLAISDTRHFNKRWYLTYELVNCDELIKIQNFQLFQNALDKQFNFIKLKHLYLYSDSKKNQQIYFDLIELVNHFDQLETLELVGLQNSRGDKCLSLNNLITLNIDEFQFDHLILDCVKLTNLRMIFCYDYDFKNLIEFNYPLSIKSLEVIRLCSEYVENFSNLEYLYLTHIYHIRDHFLLELPKLKEFHFNGEFNVFESLVDQKKLFKRDQFKIVAFGYEFEDGILPEEYYQINYYNSDLNSVKFIKNNYSKLVVDYLIHVHSICFNDFEFHFAKSIPNELILKLVNLKVFRVMRRVNNADQLINLLKIIGKSLTQINIESSFLNQNVFDLLPKLSPILDILTIKEKNPLNYDFIVQFKSLKFIEINQEITKELVRSTFQKYENLELFSSIFNGHRARINRIGKKLNLILINADSYKQIKSNVILKLKTDLDLDNWI